MATQFALSLSKELEIIRLFCLRKEYKLAVAESVTSGLLQVLFSTMKEAGLFYHGGITTYCCEMKHKHLHIPLASCEPTTGVDKLITEKMARNICGLFNAHVGLAITGFASPIPEQEIYEKVAYASIYVNGKLLASEKILSKEKEQLAVQMDFAEQLIKLFVQCIGRFSN